MISGFFDGNFWASQHKNPQVYEQRIPHQDSIIAVFFELEIMSFIVSFIISHVNFLKLFCQKSFIDILTACL